MQLAVIGAGYVGLVAAACLADLGYVVACVERDAARVVELSRGRVPFHEPGLEEVVDRARRAGRLRFTDEVGDGVRGAAVVFLAVGTPPGPDGHPDTSALFSAVEGLAAHVDRGALVAIKSTVPVGTADRVRQRLHDALRGDVEVVSNPEFLAEGTAVTDFSRPHRVVLGYREPRAGRLMEQLYAPLVRTGRPILHMDNRSAELAKYASNAMLAARVSLMNELASLSEAVGADIERVRAVVGADERIGARYLFPGAGFGGSCFPKDLLALEALAAEVQRPARMVTATRETNLAQKRVLHGKLVELLGSLSGARIAVWGVAFKPGTDDIRQAPALTLVDALLADGAEVVLYDPEALGRARERYGARVICAPSALDAVSGADALAVATEWAEFRGAELAEVARRMRGRIIVDGRNLYDPDQVVGAGLVYASIGRVTRAPAEPSEP